jgi:hypothetical protein
VAGLLGSALFLSGGSRSESGAVPQPWVVNLFEDSQQVGMPIQGLQL